MKLVQIERDALLKPLQAVTGIVEKRHTLPILSNVLIERTKDRLNLVATDLEIQELLGARYPAIEKRVAMITQSLNNIFEREHTMSLDRLKTISKRDARQFLRDLPEIHPFVEAYVMLFAFDGHSFPCDDETLDFLKGHHVVEDSTSLDECQRFVEHHLKAEECYEFFACLRAGALEGGKKKKK